MFKNGRLANIFLYLAASAILFISLPGAVWPHCDTESGPVAVAARKALETGENFNESLVVYKMGGKAGALAKRYFMETAVRLHREAEGMSYSGLKPAQPLPIDVAKAEKALETGNLKPVTNLLSMELQKETQKWFQKAVDAKKKYRNERVDDGREWVDAYVKYVIYVHGLYLKIQAGPKHGIGHVE